MDNKICSVCGAQLPEDAMFCPECTKATEEVLTPVAQEITEPTAEEAVTEDAAPAKEAAPARPMIRRKTKRAKIKWISKTVRVSLVALAALIALIFSFLPVASLGMGNVMPVISLDVEFDVSPIDTVVFAVSSFSSYTDEELADTKIGKEAAELEEKMKEMFSFTTDYDDLDDNDRFEDLLSEYCYKMVIMELMREGKHAPASYYFTAILSIVYILVALAAFVLAVLSLLSHLGVIGGEKGLTTWATRLTTFLPALIIALFAAMSFAYTDGVAEIDACAGFTLTLVFTLIAIAYTATERLIFTKDRNIKALITRCVSIVLAILVIVFATAPIAVTTIEETDTKKIDYYASSFNAFAASDDEYKEWEEFNDNASRVEKEEYFADFHYSKFTTLNSILATGAVGRAANTELITEMIGIKAGKSVGTLFSAFPLFFMSAVLFGALIMRESLMHLATGKRKKGSLISYRILVALFAILALATAIALTILTGALSEMYLPEAYSIGIGHGAICLTVFALLLAATPALNSKKVEEEEEDDYEYVCEEDILTPTAAPAATAPKTDIMSNIAAVKALKELLDMGAITEEEFKAKKSELLGI